ncbi:hypothetical protein PanWU01x14_180220 [Parasponia andersonii]|uniref:Uncharacterized protein n=1 Tax=Parasponia andersonii TaxID=3476 RepID=A0A2P5C6F1_PARAD|nr:hypothetical protein PanWU01x14_180220 [Parasponia andersonii]
MLIHSKGRDEAYTDFMFFWSFLVFGHNNLKNSSCFITVRFQFTVFRYTGWEGNFPDELPRGAVLRLQKGPIDHCFHGLMPVLTNSKHYR